MANSGTESINGRPSTVYEPLPWGHIRLLHLSPSQESNTMSCWLRSHSLADDVKYTCLSYTWIDPESQAADANVRVKVNNYPIQIGSNLASALHELYNAGQFTVWADAISINQADLQERSSQVLLMGQIYRQASKVVVWLGRDTPAVHSSIGYAAAAYDFLEGVLQLLEIDPFQAEDSLFFSARLAEFLCQLKESETYDAVVHGLQRIQALDYWRRAWIIQEICLNDNVEIRTGQRTIDWNSFGRVFNFIRANQGDSEVRKFVSAFAQRSTLDPLTTRNRPFEVLNSLHSIRSRPKASLLWLLPLTRLTKQSDPRDALYAKLGLACDAEQIVPTPDYQDSVENIFTTFAKACIEKRGLYVICMSHPCESKREMPSWVPDWSSPDASSQLNGRQREFHSTRDCIPRVSFADDCRTLCTQGFTFGVLPLGTDVTVPRDVAGRPDAEKATQIVKSFFRSILAATYLAFKAYAFTELPEQMLLVVMDAAISIASDITHQSATHATDESSAIRVFGAWLHSFESTQLGPMSLRQWIKACSRDYQETETFRHHALEELEMGDQANTSDAVLIRYTISAKAISTNRRVVVLAGGTMCLAPKTAVAGDKICFLFGCPVPVVLRSLDDHYIFIGECYVDGNMHGEAMDSLEEGKFSETTFAIK